LREGEYAGVWRPVEQARGFGRVLDDRQAGRRGRRLEREARLHRDLVGWRKPAEQLAELEVVENPPGSLVVVTRPARLLQLERDGHVPDDGDHALRSEERRVGKGCR